MAAYSTIAYDDTGAPIARVTLNRPDKRNPIGPLTSGELIHALSFILQRLVPGFAMEGDGKRITPGKKALNLLRYNLVNPGILL